MRTKVILLLVIFLLLQFLSPCLTFSNNTALSRFWSVNQSEIQVIDFGTVVKGSTASKAIKFTAEEANTSNIECITATVDKWIKLEPERFVMKPSETIELTITITTTSLSTREHVGQFNIYSNGLPSHLIYSVKVKIIELKPKLQLTEREIIFDPIRIGQKASKKVELKNVGGSILQGKSFPSASWLKSFPGDFTINAGDGIFLTISVDSSYLDNKYYSGLIKIESNGGNDQINIRIEVREDVPYLEVDPLTIDLGEVIIGQKFGKGFVVKNTGNAVLKGVLGASAEWLIVSITEFQVYKNSQIEINFSIDTTNLKEGYYSDLILVDSNGGNAKIAVRMKVLEEKPIFGIDVESIDLGTIKTEEKLQRDITIKNNGGGILEGKIIVSSDWIVLSKDSFKLGKNESFTFFVEFIPKKMQIRKLNEKIITHSNISTLEIVVSANRIAFAPIISIEEKEIDFGTVEIGSFATKVIKILNNGESDLMIQIDSTIPWLSISRSELIVYRDKTEELQLTIKPYEDLKESYYRESIEIVSNGGNHSLLIKVHFVEKTITINLTIGKEVAYVNNLPIPLDVPAQIIKGRTMVPVRFISDAFQAEVKFIPYPTNEVQIRYLDTFIHLWIENKNAKIEYSPETGKPSQEFLLDSPPTIQKGRTIVPVGFISTGFGATIAWDAKAQTIQISLKLRRGC
jgi:hypothetical protein